VTGFYCIPGCPTQAHLSAVSGGSEKGHFPPRLKWKNGEAVFMVQSQMCRAFHGIYKSVTRNFKMLLAALNLWLPFFSSSKYPMHHSFSLVLVGSSME
jgi:hypothetical protein